MKRTSENYLDYIPEKNPAYSQRLESLEETALRTVSKGAWFVDEEGMVTLLMENRGIMNRGAQKFLKKPRVTQIHMEEMGSFIWLRIDGEKTIYEIGEEMQEHFGEKAEPLYERLVVYMRNLAAGGYIKYKK